MADPSIKRITQQLEGLTISSSNIQSVGEEIGRGAYGRVYTVKCCGLICAAKEIHPILLGDDVGQEERSRVREGFLRECHHCSALKHPNIVRFIGVYYPKSDSNIPAMIMELMDESLVSYMKKLPKDALIEKGSILVDVAEGLSYLHAQWPVVIHRDLSPNNILLKKGEGEIPVAKISDLGVAKMIKADASTETQRMLTKVPGTVDFMPPEAFARSPVYGVGIDVFSYGGIMLFVATHKWPTPTEQVEVDPVTNKLVARSEVERRQEYLDEMTGDLKAFKPLVESCLSNNPAVRPTMPAVSRALKVVPTAKESPPLVPALQSGCFELTWENHADLPSPMYAASAILHKRNIYVMAGNAPKNDTLDYVFSYNININEWNRLPPPGHYRGKLQILNDKLTVIGGVDNATNEVTNKVSTFNNNSNTWVKYFPNLLKSRGNPGVVTHEDHVVVLGGGLGGSDDIEVLNLTEPSQWMQSNIKLPEPMWNISLTISHDQLYIVGYSTSGGRSSTAYQLPVASIITSTVQPPTSGQSVDWNKLPNAPHYYTALLPHSYPPVIIGGSIKDVPTSDVAILDITKNKWNRLASLSIARNNVAIVPISHESILVIGGCTGGEGVAGAKAHSISSVEKGTFSVSHTVATMPTQDSTCSIQ